MSEQATVQQLFKRWRNEGDGAAGQEMAQKFSDWYYAVTAARLGDKVGRQPLETACQQFEAGIVQVKRTSDLVDWAHSLVAAQMTAVGGRVAGGDFPNALTGNRSPTELLHAAAKALPAQQVELLAITFDPTVDEDRLGDAAEAHGGMPHAILEARYALKRFLRDTAQVRLAVVPDSPNLDLAPLPLYEAARMRSEAEEAAFEKWLLSDIELCKDVAEFATFAHALRAGAFKGQVRSSSAPAAAPSAPRTTPAAPVSAPTAGPEAPVADAADAPAAKKGGSGALIAVGVVLLLVLAVIAAGLLFFFVG
ncbi:MAG: hypothetical protein H6742_05570 [Alphaproteobacteria bacterium]|nr:hypothetical protein [Alphaproteobacteria bacterium]